MGRNSNLPPPYFHFLFVLVTMCGDFLDRLPNGEPPGPAAQAHDPAVGHHQSLQRARVDPDLVNPSKNYKKSVDPDLDNPSSKNDDKSVDPYLVNPSRKMVSKVLVQILSIRLKMINKNVLI